MLAAMFSSRHQTARVNGAVFIDRDGLRFRHVLNYLRDGVLHVKPDVVLCASRPLPCTPGASIPQSVVAQADCGADTHGEAGTHADQELLDEAEYFGLQGMKGMLLELIDGWEQEDAQLREESSRGPAVDPVAAALLPLLLSSQQTSAQLLTDIPGLASYLELQDPKAKYTFATDVEF
jgi:hypothetical protein